MQNVCFDNYEELAWDIAENFDNVREFDEYNDVAIIAKYEETRQIIKELLCIGYDIASIHLDSDEYGEYSDEYVITLTNIDGEDEIWTEPFKRENGYLTEEATAIYVMDNCSSKVIPYCKSNIVFEVSVREEECDCVECCGCCENSDDKELAIESDGDMHGFSVNHSDENGYSSYSFYSTDLSLVNEMAKLFR